MLKEKLSYRIENYINDNNEYVCDSSQKNSLISIMKKNKLIYDKEVVYMTEILEQEGNIYS